MSDLALKCVNLEAECDRLRERAEKAEAERDGYKVTASSGVEADIWKEVTARIDNLITSQIPNVRRLERSHDALLARIANFDAEMTNMLADQEKRIERARRYVNRIDELQKRAEKAEAKLAENEKSGGIINAAAKLIISDRERAETAEAQWGRYRNEAAANHESLCEALANNDRLSEINKELVAALGELVSWWSRPGFLLESDAVVEERMSRARAALTKATEQSANEGS